MFDKIKTKIGRKRMNVEPVIEAELIAYLSDFNFTNCHKCCKLSKIKCAGGFRFREEKVKEFNKAN